MLDVTQQFRDNIQKLGRQLDVVITWDDVELHGEDVVSCNKQFEGNLYSTIMQYVNIELEGNQDIKGKTINIKLGVSFNGSAFSYVDFGDFIVDDESVEYIEETESTQFSAYDYIYETCKTYDGTQFTFPITVKEYLIAICDLLGIECEVEDFPNSSKELSSNPFENQVVTYRDVFDHICKASGRNIIIRNNKLVITDFVQTDVLFDENILSSLKIGSKWGPINSIVLAREPQEDNIYKQDETSITENGLTEIRIADNYIIESNREEFIDELFETVNGVEFYAHDCESYGYGYLEPCDLITIVDTSGNTYKSVVLKDSLQIIQGIKECNSFEAPTITTTDYNKASQSEKKSMNATLYVNKQLGNVSSIVSSLSSDVNSVIEKTSVVEQNISGIYTTIEETKKELQDNIDVVTEKQATYDQTINGFSATYVSQESYQDDMTNLVTTGALTKYFRYDAEYVENDQEVGALLIGYKDETNNIFNEIKVNSVGMGLLENGEKMVYVENNKTLLKNATINGYLQIGETDGLKWIEEDDSENGWSLTI